MSDDRETGTCPVCQRQVWLTPDGHVDDHNRIPGHPSEGICRGTGRLPTAEAS